LEILRINAVLAKTGHASPSTIYGLVKQGLFVRQISIGPRAVGWPDSEIDCLNRARAAGKTDEQIKKLVRDLHRRRTAE